MKIAFQTFFEIGIIILLWHSYPGETYLAYSYSGKNDFIRWKGKGKYVRSPESLHF